MNSRQEKGTARVLSGGQTAVGMREISEMEYSQVGVPSIEKGGINNTKETGITECLTGKGLNTLKTDKDMKALSSRTSSMGKEFSTKTTLSSMEFGKTTNSQW